MKEGFAHIAGKKIYYRLLLPDLHDGNRPLLVFLHEGLGSVAQWKGFPATLARELNCAALVYDRLRYGKSDALEKDFHSGYMHDEAREYLPQLLDVLNISQKVILIGHSDGGSIALLFAAMFPERVAAVVSEADHVISEPITRRGIVSAVEAWKTTDLKSRLQRYHGEKTEALFRGWSGFLLSEEGVQWSITEELVKISCPVLAIQGKDDHFGSAEQLAIKLNTLAGPVQIALLDHCGHIPHLEQKDQVLKLIIHFLQPVLAESPALQTKEP